VTLARDFFDDAAHIGKETHVEHAIGFVEHEEFDVLKVAGALLDVIEEASRRGDDDVGAVLQGLGLAAIADTAENHGHFELGKAGIIPKRSFDLGGEFARGFENERARATAGFAEFGENREGKGSSLAGAGLRAADHVLAGEDERNRAKLNWRRIDVARCLNPVQHRWR